MFTDAAPSTGVTAEPAPMTPVLPADQQPALQLSLDVVMQDNYLGDLPGGAQPGQFYSAEGSPLLSQLGANTTLRELTYGLGPSGYFRNGVEFEPLWNCPGTDMASGRGMVSQMWVALIAGGMHSSLGFIYEPQVGTDLNIYPSDSWPWLGNTSYQVHYHMDHAAFFAQRLRLLLPAIAAPFGHLTSHPTVTVDVDPDLKTVDDAAGVYNIRARAWSTPAASATTPSNCTFLVVVNLLENAPTQFSLVLSPPPFNATPANRLFDATYDVNVSAGGRLRDWVAHGDTNIYRIGTGCPEK